MHFELEALHKNHKNKYDFKAMSKMFIILLWGQFIGALHPRQSAWDQAPSLH